jgi:DNA-binding MarR family transcriptional regulator
MNILDTLTHARRMGISPSGLHALLAVIDDSPALPSVIAERTGTSCSNVTGVLDLLERDGWIERRPYGKDRRKRPVIATEKACETFSPILS